MSGGITVEFDTAALEKALAGLSQDALREALAVAAGDLAMIGEARAKAVTPQVTGNARRSTVSDVTGQDKAVRGRYPYLNWLDTGEDSRGRKMRTRPGGYQIRRETLSEVQTKAKAVLAMVA